MQMWLRRFVALRQYKFSDTVPQYSDFLHLPTANAFCLININPVNELSDKLSVYLRTTLRNAAALGVVSCSGEIISFISATRAVRVFYSAS